MNKGLKQIVIGLVVAGAALALAACSSDSGAPVVPETTSVSPVATATTVPTLSSSTPTLIIPEATTLPIAEPTVTPSLATVFSDFGFTLKLDRGADVQTTGWTESAASLTQGLASFAYGGVNTSLVWGPSENRVPLEFLASTYNVLRAAQPNITFESISDGNITVSEQSGSFGGFKAVDASSTTVGGGLIGTWNCGNGTAFRMTVTSVDATVAQLRFDRLLKNFSCPK
ncbi:MAG: hypothetical protein HQ475_04070 [SAR202 cluster bacterium]|nr:hypothetical protein [SAR202 cluster bacterium]